MKAMKRNFLALSDFLIRLIAIPRPLWFLTEIGTELRIDFSEEEYGRRPDEEVGNMVLVDARTSRRYFISKHELANVRICDGVLDGVHTTDDFDRVCGGKRFIDCGITSCNDLEKVKLTLRGRVYTYNRWAKSCFIPLYVNKAYSGYAEFMLKRIATGGITMEDHIKLHQTSVIDGYEDYKNLKYYPVFSLSL